MVNEVSPAAKITKENATEESIIKELEKRKSHELIIGLCGAIGAGTKELGSNLKTSLENHGYNVEFIKITSIIYQLKNDLSLSGLTGYEKYYQYQIAGNEIRKAMGTIKLAAEAIAEIVDKREKYIQTPPAEKNGKKTDEYKTTEKVAYIIDQLKHPDEVTLLKTVYKQNFYLLGLITTDKERKNYLEQQSIKADKIDDLIHRDRKDTYSFGQQVEKTFHLADYFIRNRHSHAAHLNTAIERFIKLVHGYNGITPTHDEIGMYEAFSASLRSACLSRQVGASIMNENGDILATGCNDVPAYGGGLYSSEDGNNDFRCVHKGGKCFNDHHKKLLQEEFKKILNEEFEEILSKELKEKTNDAEKDSVKKLTANLIKNIEKISSKLLKNTKAKDLIEYSRAVHAEMDALVQLARTEGQTTLNAKLYCTTYPCHSCARHIVAAGISKVIYIEPYEKSLALQLHDDSITDIGQVEKVMFEPFEGVSPRRYSKFFLAFNRKDKDGKAIFEQPRNSDHIDPQFLDSYHEYEQKVVQRSDKQVNPFMAANTQ